MQTEETNNSTDSLENLQYANPSQVVLDGPLSEQNRVFAQAAMGELKRPLDQDEDDDDDSTGHPADIKPAKKTRGRVKIDMKFISNKLRRYTTFSKRKTGIMKKAYELSTLTGTQVMLLVASETGHVYTFATRKLQPMITSESGKALIQTCLNSPDPPVSQVPNPDQRMSATGYEETDLTYTVNENDVDKDRGGIYTTQQIDGGHQLGLANTTMTGITAMSASGHSFPITTYIPQQSTNKSSVNPSSYSVQAMPGGAFTTIFTPGSNVGGTPVQLQQAGQGTQQHALLAHQVQLQRGQSQTTSSQGHSTPTITTVQIGSDGQIHSAQEQSVDQSPGNPANIQSLGTLMVPIATHQGEGSQVVSLASVVPSSMMLTTQAGQIPVMYYAGPSSGLVSQLNESEQAAVHNHHLQNDVSEVSQSLAGTLSLSNVHVQHDMTASYHGQSVVTENSGTQTPDEVHNVINDSSMTDGASPKHELPDSDSHAEV